MKKKKNKQTKSSSRSPPALRRVCTAQERARLPLQVWAGPGSSWCVSVSPVTAACPLPVLYSAWGGLRARAPAASPARGGHTVHGDAAPRRERGCSPTRQDGSQLSSTWGAAQGRGSRNGRALCQKKPTAGLADPRPSAQTRLPFYLGTRDSCTGTSGPVPAAAAVPSTFQKALGGKHPALPPPCRALGNPNCWKSHPDGNPTCVLCSRSPPGTV